MPSPTHPVEFVDRFLKEAAMALPKPYGMADAKRATSAKVPRGPQIYTAPTPPTSTTQPDLVANQKATPSPAL